MVAHPKPTAEEEDAFMRDLLTGIDDSFWNSSLTPDTSPAKSRDRPKADSRNSHQTPIMKRTRSIHSTPLRYSTKRARLSENKPQPPHGKGEDLGILLEGAEDWDWDDMNSDFLTPVKKKNQQVQNAPSTTNYNPAPCARCVVAEIIDDYFSGRPAKRLELKIDGSKQARRALLQDDWADLDVRSGDIVNVLGAFDTQDPPTIQITASHNLLIHHPDILLTATSVSNALQCRRKPLLSALVKSASTGATSNTISNVTPALVWGNMLHEVMQRCWKEGRWEEDWIEEQIHNVIHQNLSDLVTIGLTVEQAKNEMRDRAKGLQAFRSRYLGATPKKDAILNNTRSKENENSYLAISELYDIEEEIMSPRYGLKGKIDASVQAIIEDRVPLGKTTHAHPMPFEIKTGRSIGVMEHRAQTMLYTFMMAERYREDVPAGLLYYTQLHEVTRVPVGRHEVRGLIQARNEMAGYLARREIRSKQTEKRFHVSRNGEAEEPSVPEVEEAVLPPTIDDERACKRCYAADTCMLYRKAVEQVVDTTSPIANLYDMKTSHLTDVHCAFFKKWEALIAMEEHDMLRFKKELWTMTAAERETRNKCLANMVLTPTSPQRSDLEIGISGGREDRIRRLTYTFVKAASASTSTSASANSAPLTGAMHVGDAIVVSAEPNFLAFSRGFVTHMTPHAITVNVDHEIEEASLRTRLSEPTLGPVVFRIDRDELSGGMARIRENLAQLFYVYGDERRRELVVDLKAPRFDGDARRMKEVDAIVPPTLNERQREAMHKVLAAEDYALILGMPGTGKTTTIAELIKVLVGRGKTVLLASYTHSAVDTILLKLKDAEFEILRVGNQDKVHPDARCFTLSARTPATSTEQLESQLLSPPVVATTCLSLDNALFSRRTFDYCIVDEASQVTLPTCLGPLRFAHRFVLVGDHYQLPPLVRSSAARQGGFDCSLFRILTEAHPNAVVDLNEQYRMNRDIMLLSNKLIYNDRLKCGSEAVAQRTLALPSRSFLDLLHKGSEGASRCEGERCWVERLLKPSSTAVFVDTDDVPGHDSRVGDLVQNDVEAALVFQLTESLLRSGTHPSQIGVISLYRQQIKFLSQKLGHHPGVEVLTADRSQGRDKDCIIVSMVRSNSAGQVGELLKDWRRLNVSFTRARSKLIIIGSRSTLSSLALLSQFFDLMASKGWIVKLPRDAHLVHAGHFMPLSESQMAGDKQLPSGNVAMAIREEVKQKENIPSVRKRSKGVQKVDGLLKSRPILRDLVNDTK